MFLMEKLGVAKLASGVMGPSPAVAGINNARRSAGDWALLEDVLTAENTVRVLVICQHSQRAPRFGVLSFIPGSQGPLVSLRQRELFSSVPLVTSKPPVYNAVVQVRKS